MRVGELLRTAQGPSSAGLERGRRGHVLQGVDKVAGDPAAADEAPSHGSRWR